MKKKIPEATQEEEEKEEEEAQKDEEEKTQKDEEEENASLYKFYDSLKKKTVSRI